MLYFHGIFNTILSHIPDHFPASHLGIGSLGHQLIPCLFAEYYSDISIICRQIFLNASGIFLGSKIDDDAALIPHCFIQPAPPIGIHIPGGSYGSLRLHFQAVGNHPVHRPQNTIKSRQNPQVLLHIFKMAILKHRRCHILICQPLISQHCRCQISCQIQLLKPPEIQPGYFVIAAPKLLQLRI